jgi:hypothetical protein
VNASPPPPTGIAARPTRPTPARRPDGVVLAAHRLREELHRHGIAADVHDGFGRALVSVWVDLVVWCHPTAYYWWSGRISPQTRQRTYCYSPTNDPVTTARRVAARYAQLRNEHPLSPLINDISTGAAVGGEAECR